MNNIINIKNLDYKNIFDNLDLSIEENKFTSVSGANNSGKTTLLRILAGQIYTDSSIKILNKDIKEYKNQELSSIVQIVIPQEIIFSSDNLLNELAVYDESDLIDYVLKGLKIKKIQTKSFIQYDNKEIILAQLALALINKPRVLLIDYISCYFSRKEMDSIISFLKQYQEKYGLTIVMTTINLDDCINTDKLFFISEGKIVLSGEPMSVLEKDNIINKIGLNIPFMIDLSVKLRDYELLSKIEMNKDRMVEELWK